MMNNDPEDDPIDLKAETTLLRALGLQISDRGATRRNWSDHHPHYALGWIPMASHSNVLERRRI